MADKEHSTLTGASLHENKGVAAASDNTVATATGGATVWKKLTSVNLTGTAEPFGSQLLHVRNQVASGTNGASLTTGPTWNTRILNTVVTNEISASLASNQITLSAGTYFAEVAVSFRANLNVNNGLIGIVRDQVRLFNVTGSTALLKGLGNYISIYRPSTNSGDIYSLERSLKGRFTLAGTSAISLQHYVDLTSGTVATTATEGAAINSGTDEVYADVLIWKIS